MIKLLLILLLICSPVYAGVTINPESGGLDVTPDVQEEDGSPVCYAPSGIKVTNATLTCNADGTASVVTGGGAEVNNLETICTDIADDEIPVGTAADTVIYKALPDCDTAATSKLLYDTTTNTFSCGTDQNDGGATSWDDIGDPDNDGLTTIDFNHASENTILTNIYDAAGTFFKIDNSDADLANEVTLLGLEFTDDASANGIFIKATDNNGDTVWQLGADGKMTIGPGAGDYILPTVRGTADQILADSGAGAGAIQFRDMSAIETDPNVDTADEIEAILVNDNIDFGTGTVTTDGLIVQGNADIEGYASIGNGSALDVNNTLIVDRDFTDSANNNLSQILVGGIITSDTFAPDNHMVGIDISPGGLIADAVSPPIMASLYVQEPNITEVNGGSALLSATLYIKDAPTEGTSNFAIRVDDGDVQFDGNMEAATITEGGIAVLNNDEIDASSELLAIMDDETGSASGSPLLVFNQNPTIAAMVGTGLIDFGGAVLEIPNSTSLPGTCNVGESYMDTDATSGQRFYLCESSNTWKLQGDGGGAGGGRTSYSLPIYSAKLTGAYVVFTPPTADACTQGAQIDAGDGNWRLLFDASTDECATWQFIMPDNYASDPLLDVMFSMASGESDEVEFEAAIMCVTPTTDTADIGTASFSNVAVGTATTVSATAGESYLQTITLTDDSCSAGDIVFVVLSTDANDAANDDATGDREIVGVNLRYTGS